MLAFAIYVWNYQRTWYCLIFSDRELQLKIQLYTELSSYYTKHSVLLFSYEKNFSFKTAFFSIISEIHRFVYSDLQCINFVSSIVSQYKKYKMVLGMRFELQYFLFKVKWVLDMKIIIWLFCYFIYPGCKLMSYDSRNTINTFFTTHFFPLTQRITILKCDNDLFWKPRIKSKTLSCCYH